MPKPWSQVGAVLAGAGFDELQEDVARFEDARVVGEQAEHDTHQEAFEVVAPVVGGVERVVQPPDQLRGLDVGGVLIAEGALLDAEDEAEVLHVRGKVLEAESDLCSLVEIVQLEGLEIADEDVAGTFPLLERIEVLSGLTVGFAEIAAGALLLDDQDARPEQVDEAGTVVELRYMLLIARHRPALHSEHAEEGVVEAVRFARLANRIAPFVGECGRTDPDLVP